MLHIVGFVLDLLRALGFSVHLTKSLLNPRKRFQFLSFACDTTQFSVTAVMAQLAKWSSGQLLMVQLKYAFPPMEHHMTSVIDQCDHCDPSHLLGVSPHAPCLIQWFLSSVWGLNKETIKFPISLEGFPWNAVMWFHKPANFFSSVPIREPLPNHYMDASLEMRWTSRQQLGDTDIVGYQFFPSTHTLTRVEGVESSVGSLLSASHEHNPVIVYGQHNKNQKDTVFSEKRTDC